MQVFDIEDMGGASTAARAVAVAARPRDCTMCRECIRLPGWENRVQLRRKADHFIFSVETAGSLRPEDIVKRAIAILRAKAKTFLQLAEEYEDDMVRKANDAVAFEEAVGNGAEEDAAET